MAKQKKTRPERARRLRARAGKLCDRSNRLRTRADELYEQAEAAVAESKELLAKADDLYAGANALHGHVVRRQCLKCDGAFGSTDFSNRMCRTCATANASLREGPSSPAKWNGQPMSDGMLKL